jgi:hypothetical protein
VKIDFSAILLNLNGVPLMQPVVDGVPAIPATLSWVAAEALLRATEEKDGQKKYRLYKLAMRIGNGGEVDVPVEDVALMKQLIGEQFAPLVVGRAFDLLERVEA